MESAVLFAVVVALVLPSGTNSNGLMMPDLSGMQSLGGLQMPQMPQMSQMPQLNMGGFPNLLPQLQGNSLDNVEVERTPCSCGVFLNGQFKRGSKEQPTGNAALLQELYESFPCNPMGDKQCQNKCLETLMKYLPNSPLMVCGSIDRDCHKERAYLFIKNCRDRWINTNLSAGREYCCKDGSPYKCP